MIELTHIAHDTHWVLAIKALRAYARSDPASYNAPSLQWAHEAARQVRDGVPCTVFARAGHRDDDVLRELRENGWDGRVLGEKLSVSVPPQHVELLRAFVTAIGGGVA